MTNEKPKQADAPTNNEQDGQDKAATNTEEEIGGFGKKGNGMPEPTRYNDWEVKGRCSDF